MVGRYEMNLSSRRKRGIQVRDERKNAFKKPENPVFIKKITFFIKNFFLNP